MYQAKAYAAASAKSPLASATIPRRDLADHDVQIDILFVRQAAVFGTRQRQQFADHFV